MAVGNFNGGNTVYLGVSNGKIVQSFKTKTEHSTERVNKAGKLVYEEHYDFVEGIIKGLSTKENDYGKFWVITLESDGKTYLLEFNYSGGISQSFLKALPNVKLGNPVRLVPRVSEDPISGKKKAVMFINQNEQGIKHFFTKDNPNGMPDLVKVKIKGKETWDDSDRMEFLERYCKALFNAPQLDVVDEDIPF